MQNAKDSFYLALRLRLAALNPTRVVTIENIVRPAIVVAENEIVGEEQPDTFYLHWGATEAIATAGGFPKAMLKTDCHFRYWVEGSQVMSFQDRGRALARSDEELLQILYPWRTPLRDYTGTDPVELGGYLFWARPVFAAVEEDGGRLKRQATVAVFGFSEVDG